MYRDISSAAVLLFSPIYLSINVDMSLLSSHEISHVTSNFSLLLHLSICRPDIISVYLCYQICVD